MSGVAEEWWAKEETDLTYRLACLAQYGVAQGQRGWEKNAYGTMFATVGGGVDATVEAESECVAWEERNHVQARTKGGGDRPPRLRLLQWQDQRIPVSRRNKQGA
jgi:hypothetical protein